MARPRPLPKVRSDLKRKVDRAIHHPVVEFALIGAILLSVVVILLEEMQPAGGPEAKRLEWIGLGFSALFAVELSLRYWVARTKRRFFARYWIDILAIIPWARGLRFLRALRLLRLFRAGALLNRRLSVFRGAVRATAQEIVMLVTAMIALVLTGGLLLQHYDGGPSGSSFATLQEALLFALASTIAGEPTFGEPTGPVGKLITLGLMLGGLTTFGLFIGTVSATMMARISRTLEITVMELDELTQHTIICGWNGGGGMILDELFLAGRDEPVVLITEAESAPEEIHQVERQDLIYWLKGDYTRVEVLERANITEASSAILLADTVVHRSEQDRDARTVLAALTVEKLAPSIFTIAELNNRDNESLLRMAGVEEIVVAEEYGAVVMGSAERNRGLVQVVDEILTSRYGNAFQKAEVTERLAGRDIGELHEMLKREQDAVLVAHIACSDGVELSVDVNPSVDKQVSTGDRLVVIASERPRL